MLLHLFCAESVFFSEDHLPILTSAESEVPVSFPRSLQLQGTCSRHVTALCKPLCDLRLQGTCPRHHNSTLHASV